MTAGHRLVSKARRQTGMALLAVLWMVAALSIMMAGVIHVVRGELRIVGNARLDVVNTALADAAIRVALRDIGVNKDKGIRFAQNRSVSIFASEIKVLAQPLNGQVDLNNAGAGLLSDVFHYGGEEPRSLADSLADEVVQMRNQKNSQGESVRFHAVEDLLLLTKLGYSTYAKIKSIVTADLNGGGRVNPLAASLDTLRVLAKGDVELARQLYASRFSNPEFMDTTRLTATHIETASSSRLAIQAIIRLDDRTSFMREWRVDVAASAHGLPWRVLGLDTGRMVQIPLVQ